MFIIKYDSTLQCRENRSLTEPLYTGYDLQGCMERHEEAWGFPPSASAKLFFITGIIKYNVVT